MSRFDALDWEDSAVFTRRFASATSLAICQIRIVLGHGVVDASIQFNCGMWVQLPIKIAKEPLNLKSTPVSSITFVSIATRSRKVGASVENRVYHFLIQRAVRSHYEKSTLNSVL